LGNETAGYEPTWMSGTDCMYGTCLAFEGTPGVDADVVDVSDIPNGDLTIMAWIYPKQVLGDERAIVSKWSSAGGTAEWLFRLYNSSSANMVFIMYNTSADYEERGSSGANIGTGGWTHVAVSYNITSGQVRFYRNGSSVGGGTFNGPMRDGSAIVKIGSQGYGTLDPFNGTIDGVRIFDKVLNQTEVQNEMNSDLPILRPIATWSFDEGSGTIANDTHIWVKGKYGSALSFDGVDDYTETPDHSSLDVSNLTITTWVKFATDNNDGVILRKISYISGGYLLYISNSGGRMILDYANSTDTCYPYSNSLTWEKDTWYFISVNHNENTGETKFYRDGNPVGGDIELCRFIAPTDETFDVARSTGGIPWNGAIDEVRIWNRTLTQTEIQEEMNRS